MDRQAPDLTDLADAFGRLARDRRTAALVVRRGDEVLLDLSTGRDVRGRPFTRATSVFLYSAVTPVGALAVLLAVADGALPLDSPVAQLWPEFGVRG